MFWRAPENFGSMSFRGRTISADAQGRLDLSTFDPGFAHDLVWVLRSHGFAPIPESAHPSEPDAVDAMKRADLFAHIKAHGGSAHIGLRNDELRAIAREVGKA